MKHVITGPFKINGVPLRRVNQSYVIATSTKVDVSGVNVEKFDDKYFGKKVEKKKKKGEGEFFEAEKAEVRVMTQHCFSINFFLLFSPNFSALNICVLLQMQEKNVLPQEKKDDQKLVDTPLIKAIEGVPDLKSYLAARFSLKANMKPHELVF